jgi:hypothetical protein
MKDKVRIERQDDWYRTKTIPKNNVPPFSATLQNSVVFSVTGVGVLVPMFSKTFTKMYSNYAGSQSTGSVYDPARSGE